jgi:hypothetical protein
MSAEYIAYSCLLFCTNTIFNSASMCDNNTVYTIINIDFIKIADNANQIGCM